MEKKDNNILENKKFLAKKFKSMQSRKGLDKNMHYSKNNSIRKPMLDNDSNKVVNYSFKNKQYRNTLFGLKKKDYSKVKRLPYDEEIETKLYKPLKRKNSVNKRKIAYINARIRLKARLANTQKNVKKKNIFTLLKLNKKKFKFFSRYLGMLTMRGNTVQLENSFLFVLRKVKKIHLDNYTLRSYLTRVVNQARPYAIIISQKKGSITYRIPLYTTPKREVFQGLYWLINESCGLKKGDFKYCLLKELINLSFRTGKVMRIKANFHKLLQRNRSMIKKLNT